MRVRTVCRQVGRPAGWYGVLSVHCLQSPTVQTVQCILTTQRHHTHLRPDQAMAPWDVPHQAAGSPAPVVNPERVTVYNMRSVQFSQYNETIIVDSLTKES